MFRSYKSGVHVSLIKTSSLTIIYLIFILSINMTATGKEPQKKIPYEIREDPSDSVASTSQVKSLLRKQVQVLRHACA